ncbi:MAG: glycosyl hydrolase [Saprospiraceae bacterium]|nr:glycosyl hydrolase [Saprospiraceae bacterium]
MQRSLLLLLCAAILLALPAQAQKTRKKAEQTEQSEEKEKSLFESTAFNGLKFRELGPALTSGRISDFAMHPDNEKVYYVAVSSGGVWKTTNAGTTFTPIFDSQGSYSIGCVTVDPNNPSIVWVGTGENNNQRSVAYGDGLYKSEDGGASWKNVGLKESEHIGNIIVHPHNSDIVYVAAIGPLWSAGGDRGVYKTIDGGETWEAVLTIDEHTGVNEVHMDPRNPDVLYAAAFQRARHVYTYLGGGPGSGIYKSTDGGASWNKAMKGLPGVDLGRIGMAISPANPEVIYAIVEAAQGKSGFYRSTNRGASWEKRGGFVTSGNYYQEIIADPVDPDKVYAMDTWMKVSDDGGKSFRNVGEDTKHVDNHCMWIDPEDTDHWLVGCDGGIYETWDAAQTWHFKPNLPIIQFYKVAVDNSEPFYYIYGGTQDNFSMGGPSRMVSANGIANEDWFITHGGDGFESQVDPENPNIVYVQSQYGVLARYDKQSGEEVGIQPQARKGEDAYVWNWDAPLSISAHAAGRVYFAANKLFRSDNYGNDWQVISDDLTAQINRNELEIMGRVWSIDAVAKNRSTSPYGAIVAFSESPIDEDLLFVGTDDGLIQRTVNGGAEWTRIEGIEGVPPNTYVNAVWASQHDPQVVYACFNNHKRGDFKPYVYKSTDQGNTWTNISANLPERGSTYAIGEDHVDPNLLFVGTEFGVFFTNDGGSNWKQLKAGVPTIAVRDLAIQTRENDLVLGTFGRGFFVLDDYSSLRASKEADLAAAAHLFPVRDALQFERAYPLGLPGKSFQGDSYWQGDNLGAEALFTYYIKDEIKSLTEQRREAEKELAKEGKDVHYPTYDALKAERDEEDPALYFTVRDDAGNIVRKLETRHGTGVQRIKWDLRTAPKDPISLSSSSFYNPFSGRDEGTLVAPGTYSVTMSLWRDGAMQDLAGPVSFEVIPLNNTTMPARDREALAAFKAKVTELSRAVQGTQRAMGQVDNELRHIRKAIDRVEVPTEALMAEVLAIEETLQELRRALNGDPIANELDIRTPPSVNNRIGFINFEQKYSTSEPTGTHRMSLEIAREEFTPILNGLRTLVESDLAALRDELQRIGAPYTPGVLPDLTQF